jgi:hypothetical protein
VYTDRGVAAAEKDAAFQSFLALGHRLLPLVRNLPESALRRLGLDSAHPAFFSDWVCLLFHLAWHFPDHFAQGAVARCRLLVTDQGDRIVSEDKLQLYPVRATQDRFPGVIYSWPPRQLDLVTATEYAIDLLRCVLGSGETRTPADAVRNQFKALHEAFSETGQLLGSHACCGPFSDFEAKILRLDSSLHTPPATEWGRIPAQGALQIRFLSRNNAVKECCILHGAYVDTFLKLADQAGALLPKWPAEPYPALLEDAEHWQRRVQRRNELAGQSFRIVSESGEPPHGQVVPCTTLVDTFWWATAPSSLSQRLITDDRGNVERWIGFVIHVLKERQPDAVEIRIIREEQIGRCLPWNAILTLRDTNLFQASARALELAFRLNSVAAVGVPQGQPEPNCIVTPETAPQVPPLTPPKYVFAKTSNLLANRKGKYYLHFENECKKVDALRGLQMIEHLLKQPGIEADVLEIQKALAVDRPSRTISEDEALADTHGHEERNQFDRGHDSIAEAASRKEIEDTKATIHRLQEMSNEAEMRGDARRAKALDAQVEQGQTWIKAQERLQSEKSKKRGRGGSEKEKARNRLKNTLADALQTLKNEEMPKLAEHFEKQIVYESYTYKYNPMPPICWTFTIPSLVAEKLPPGS